MNVPVITGDGEWIPLDTDDMPRLTTAEVLAKACEDIDSRLWDLFTRSTDELPPATTGAHPDEYQQPGDKRE